MKRKDLLAYRDKDSLGRVLWWQYEREWGFPLPQEARKRFSRHLGLLWKIRNRIPRPFRKYWIWANELPALVPAHSELWSTFFPGTLAGWGRSFDGGWIRFYSHVYYFSPSLIKEGVRKQWRELRVWKKRDWIAFWHSKKEENSLSGASGRLFQLAQK